MTKLKHFGAALLLGALISTAHATPVIKTVQAGATDVSVVIKIIDATTGAPETGVVFNTTGIDLEYWRHGPNAVTDITEATQTVNGAHTDGGFVGLGNGYYRLDLPDAAVAAGAGAVEVMGTVTDMIVIGGTVQLSTDTPQTGDSFARLGAPAGASVSADIAAIEAQTDDIGVAGAGLTNITLGGLSAAALADFFDTDSGTSYASAVAGSVVKETADNSGASGVTDDRLGIIASGTAQGATSTTLQLASATSFADDEIVGATCLITGGTTGVGQSRAITDYVGSTDTATVDAWTTTPTGTITYQCFGTAPGSFSLGDGSITSSTFAAGAITASAVATDAVTEIQSGLSTLDAAGVRTAVGLASANLDTQLGAIDTVVNQIEGQTDDIGVAGAGLTNLGGLGSAAQANVRTAVGLATANLDTQLAAIDDAVDTEVAAILATTAKLDDTVEDDLGTFRFTSNALEQAPTGSGESLDAIADAVWDEAIAGHASAGSTGEALSSASAGGGLDAAGVRAAVGLATANLDTQLGDLPTNAELAALLAALPTDIRDLVIEDQGGGVTLGCAVSVLLAYGAGDLTTSGSTSTYEEPSGTETRLTGTVTSAGNRTAAITCPSY